MRLPARLPEQECVHLGAPIRNGKQGAIVLRQIANVTQLLARHRVRGISVVGLNDLKAPKWLPEPTIEELRGY